jgi:phosphatidate cytidylyltransferase
MLQFFVKVFWLFGPTEDAHWHGIFAMLWIVAVTKFCDVGAFIIGSAIGKHRMAPTISPGKSWEGAVGGVVIATAVGAAFPILFSGHMDSRLTPWVAAVFSVPIAVTAIVSDLIESIMKRSAELKDSGRTIPGIGGAFDLMDSLVLTAPVGYLLLLILVEASS